MVYLLTTKDVILVVDLRVSCFKRNENASEHHLERNSLISILSGVNHDAAASPCGRCAARLFEGTPNGHERWPILALFALDSGSMITYAIHACARPISTCFSPLRMSGV